MSFPERLLWAQLRRQQTGFKWRKQHPAGPYDLDFYCDAAKLCIEVDGEAHGRGDRPVRDLLRDRWLAEHGIVALRFPAGEVLDNLDGVLARIEANARERAPLHRASRGPPPPAAPGEEL